jgi:hypothetical protein
VAYSRTDRHPGLPTHVMDHTGRALLKAKAHRVSRKKGKLELKRMINGDR